MYFVALLFCVVCENYQDFVLLLVNVGQLMARGSITRVMTLSARGHVEGGGIIEAVMLNLKAVSYLEIASRQFLGALVLRVIVFALVMALVV